MIGIALKRISLITALLLLPLATSHAAEE